MKKKMETAEITTKERIEKQTKEEAEKAKLKELFLDFDRRRQERNKIENVWKQNLNFFLGNQFTSVNGIGEVEDFGKRFYWEEREVFNHITPIVENRLSKLSRVRPVMTAIAATDSEEDLHSAKLTKNILKSLSARLNLNKLISDASKISEIYGSVFYKVLWDNTSGDAVAITDVGSKIKMGDVDVSVVHPSEIFPENLNIDNVDSQASIIHAKIYRLDEIELLYGVKTEGESLNISEINSISAIGGHGYTGSVLRLSEKHKENVAVVIEKYERPSLNHPNGKLTIATRNKIIFEGELPYANKKDGKHGYPFIKQVAIEIPGAFFGSSVIERCIPIQRAYNSIKNRKHEFINRIAMGVLAVEDGSIDTDSLEEDGLCPGKVLVYRQGAEKPQMLSQQSLPNDFVQEEAALLNEFMLVSGSADFMQNGDALAYANLSGITLQLLIEQDDNRLSATSEQIRFAILEMSKQSIRLYKQFASLPRLSKLTSNKNEIETFYFSSSDISTDDIRFETDTELSESLTQKKAMLLDLFKNGLLADENGNISNRMRAKILENLGFGSWGINEETYKGE